MAIDTEQKRMSSVHVAMPWRGQMVRAADSGVTQGNRQAAAGFYSGILSTGGGGGPTPAPMLMLLGVGSD